MRHTEDKKPSLTKNQQLVLEALQTNAGPLSAYAILDLLRQEGFRAPLQVYRALEKLVEQGSVHRLESRNAFVACQHDDCTAHRAIAFTICEKCDRVEEINDRALTNQLNQIAATTDFALSASTVELRGVCQGCVEAR